MGTGLPTFRRGDSWSDQDSHQWNRLVDEVRGGMVTSVGPGLRMTRVPPFGTSIGLEPKLAKKIQEAAGTAEVAEFRVIESDGDILSCFRIQDDGVVDQSGYVYVAKPWDFRKSTLNNQTRWGNRFTNYNTTTDVVTVSRTGFTTEFWRILLPYFDAVSTIAAIRCGDVLNLTFTGEPVEWLDLNVGGKMWTMIV